MTAHRTGSPRDPERLIEALLFTRASPKLERARDWDAWEVDKHMYDLVRAPGLVGASMYKRSTGPVPRAFQAEARRAVVYQARDLDSLRIWLASDGLAEAVEDGRSWRDAYDPVDDEWFTGNVYQLRAREGAIPSSSSHILVERFEVPPASEGEFEAWLDAHVERLASLDGVESVQSFDVVRDIGNELYLSLGTHAVQVTFPVGSDPIATLASAAAASLFASSMTWELRLGYQTRELYTPAGHVLAPDERSGSEA